MIESLNMVDSQFNKRNESILKSPKSTLKEEK